MSIFASDALKKIYIDEKRDIYVEIEESITWNRWNTLVKEGITDTEIISIFVKSWNLADENGEVQLNKENIDRLSSKVVLPLATQILRHYAPEKKS